MTAYLLFNKNASPSNFQTRWPVNQCWINHSPSTYNRDSTFSFILILFWLSLRTSLRKSSATISCLFAYHQKYLPSQRSCISSIVSLAVTVEYSHQVAGESIYILCATAAERLTLSRNLQKTVHEDSKYTENCVSWTISFQDHIF